VYVEEFVAVLEQLVLLVEPHVIAALEVAIFALNVGLYRLLDLLLVKQVFGREGDIPDCLLGLGQNGLGVIDVKGEVQEIDLVDVVDPAQDLVLLHHEHQH